MHLVLMIVYFSAGVQVSLNGQSVTDELHVSKDNSDIKCWLTT